MSVIKGYTGVIKMHIILRNYVLNFNNNLIIDILAFYRL